MRSIGQKLTLSYVFISLITVLIMESLFFIAIYQYYVSGMTQTLINHAEASAVIFEKYAPSGKIEDKVSFIYDNMSSDEAALVEVYGVDGNFLTDNAGNKDKSTELTKDYKDALLGDTSSWKGKINTHEPIISVSVPLKERDKVIGVLRYVSSMTAAKTIIKSNTLIAIILGMLILLGSALLGYIMSARILVPVRNLTHVTREISAGNLNVKAKRFYHDEIGLLADAVNKMTEEISRSNKAKTDFISSVSHELRTPLTSIKGWAETIDDNINDSETAKLGIGIIDRETNRLIRLVNDLLDFSRLESHRIELMCEVIWLDSFLEGMYHQFLARSQQEHVNLRLHLDGQNILLYADENRLRQVVINIIDNSFKFLQNVKQPEIIIQSHMLDNQVVITIEDNGPGMTSEELMRVKEKFYKGSNKRTGTGLGLSIANEIIELHNGTLYVDSIRGIGSKVSIVLPLHEISVDNIDETLTRKIE